MKHFLGYTHNSSRICANLSFALQVNYFAECFGFIVVGITQHT